MEIEIMEYLNYLNLDKMKLPFELPLLLHPISVHFLVAIPIIILLLELVNLYLKRPYLNKITASFWFLLIFIFVFAFFAGKTDGSHAFSLLSDEGQKELKEHKQLGMILVYLSLVPFFVKLLSMAIKTRAMQIVYLITLLAFIGGILKQGYDGGELVYKYGANVKMVSKMDDKIMDLEDEVDELKEKLNSCQNSLQELKSKEENSTITLPSKEENESTTASETNETVQSINKEENKTLKEKVEENSTKEAL